MNEVPNTMGELRRELALTLHDVRYGHMESQRGLAVAKIAGQIANLMSAEIEACRFLSELGQSTQRFGATPINKSRFKPTPSLPGAETTATSSTEDEPDE